MAIGLLVALGLEAEVVAHVNQHPCLHLRWNDNLVLQRQRIGSLAPRTAEHEVDQPDAEAGDDGRFPVRHREEIGEPGRHHLQDDSRDEHLQDDEHDQTEAQGGDGSDRSQQAEEKADACEEESGAETMGPEAATDGDTRDDGRENVGEEDGHEGEADEEFHDGLSKWSG